MVSIKLRTPLPPSPPPSWWKELPEINLAPLPETEVKTFHMLALKCPFETPPKGMCSQKDRPEFTNGVIQHLSVSYQMCKLGVMRPGLYSC